jgi:hypothetical protein
MLAHMRVQGVHPGRSLWLKVVSLLADPRYGVLDRSYTTYKTYTTYLPYSCSDAITAGFPA